MSGFREILQWSHLSNILGTLYYSSYILNDDMIFERGIRASPLGRDVTK